MDSSSEVVRLDRVTKNRSRVRTIAPMTYPVLPVSARRQDIMEAIEGNQVVIIAGETGSGKTTQIPKMCLDLGRGRRRLIGHTQPRRIAARSVAERIAEETGAPVGDPTAVVGYKIRFDDTMSPTAAVKLMTDGVLLNEIQRDRLLKAYDTIIVDEAHERSLNIDFLLGYLKNLLPKRPDLKVIITSATIDPESFAEHFADEQGNPAPIIEVSGRTYPVEIRYRPLTHENTDPVTGDIHRTETDPLVGLTAACKELMAEGSGDILCFFSGEREIRDAADALSTEFGSGKVDVLPLFGRLSNAEQHRVFHPTGRRRIVLATNIAETSLTVPGIHYVIDTGYARISRYSNRTKVQRLPVEEISQASAKQRSGRSGRVADGIAIRLYSEENFDARPEFTDPEILRTHLASVILSMTALGLGDIEKFPFLQAPDNKAIRDGVMLLQELGALTHDKQADLTPIGRDLARIPTDPRLARMLAAGHANNVVEQMAVIVAALSIQDVRERPMDKQAQADQAHARFKANSDFISVLMLWNYLQQQRQELSGNQFRKLCTQEFIHYMRVREWMDLVRQLLSVIQDLQWKVPNIPHVRQLQFDPAELNEDAVHQSVLTGLLTHVGMKEGTGREFQGTRNTRFVIHPSSFLSKKPPQWVMAAELVETSQVFARTVAPVNPEWIEHVAPHLVKYTYSEPVWSAKRGAGVAKEKVMMLGLTIVADRTVNASKVDRGLAREMFIRHALVEGDWRTRHKFFHRNQEVVAEAEQLEDKARRRDIVVDDQVLFDFYDARIPDKVVSSRHFDSWWKKEKHKRPHLLDFSLDALIDSTEAAAAADEFPDSWTQGTLEFELSYVFSPGDPDDGITMRVPLPLLANVESTTTQWLVAGMRHELAVALIRTLPKPLRTTVVPATDFAAKAVEQMVPYDGAFDQSLADALRKLGGSGINATDFDWTRIPQHLRMQFAAVDRRGKVVDKDRDLGALQERLAGQVTQAIAQATARSARKQSNAPTPADGAVHRKGKKAKQAASSGGAGLGSVLTRAEKWEADGIGRIPDTVNSVIDGQEVATFPALVREGDQMVLKAFPTRQAADAQQFTTVLDMLIRAVTAHPNQMTKGLGLRQRVAIDNFPGGPEALVKDCTVTVCKQLLMAKGPVIKDPQECEALVKKARSSGSSLVRQHVVALAPAILAVADMREELKNWSGEPIQDMVRQLDFYVADHAIARHGVEHLRHVPRYVAAMQARLDLMGTDPDKEEYLDWQVREALKAFERKRQQLPSTRQASPALKKVRWMIEEFRVSLFAQHLGTAHSVSLQRINKQLAKIS
ncbi:MAG TPA: ATP-dependent RNA helicase HrpA [Candidatus Corynebacterium gallistercoris]|uniref:ATP-dependent RNA helicase HrpA n=1 Tax=Candidatus Corynebacterium gallistercoris TaxID=2838530 RepID=A0A9D1RXV0_9CORY|nr:ATP-dependent RNA helicase HrpA [Candidatus Corynebacterium gallistercoris]